MNSDYSTLTVVAVIPKHSLQNWGFKRKKEERVLDAQYLFFYN